MCLILFSFDMHPEYRLILTGNRDEFFNRPTRPLGWWADSPHILAGRDLQGSGTWLGASRCGKIGAITNFRDPATLKPDAPSRGRLITDFLSGTDSPKAYLEKLKKTGGRYNGYNLLVGDENEFWYYSNQGDHMVQITPGIHGLSNHFLNTPWPKVEKGKSAVAPIFAGQAIDFEAIFAVLGDRARPPDQQLPDTGVGEVWERLLSPLFIVSDTYGTRSSSIVLVKKDGQVTFVERTYHPGHPGDVGASGQNTIKIEFQREQK